MRVDRLSLGALGAGYTEAGAGAKAVRIESSATATATTAQTAAILNPPCLAEAKNSTAVSSVAFQAFISLLGGSMLSAAGVIPENKRDDFLGGHFAKTQKVLA